MRPSTTLCVRFNNPTAIIVDSSNIVKLIVIIIETWSRIGFIKELF